MAQFPGGYRSDEHTISALFQPTTAAGMVNPARPLATSGVVLAMVGIALLFHAVAHDAKTARQAWTVRWGGTTATVCAALTTTPAHDAMALAGAGALVVALVAILYVLYLDGAAILFAVGVLAIAGSRYSSLVLRPAIHRVPSARTEGGPRHHGRVAACSAHARHAEACQSRLSS